MKYKDLHVRMVDLKGGEKLVIKKKERPEEAPQKSHVGTVISKSEINGRYVVEYAVDGHEVPFRTRGLRLFHNFLLDSLEGQEHVWATLPNVEEGDVVQIRRNFCSVVSNTLGKDRLWNLCTVTPEGTKQMDTYRGTDKLKVKITDEIRYTYRSKPEPVHPSKSEPVPPYRIFTLQGPLDIYHL